MPIELERLERLLRLQGVAEELAEAARTRNSPYESEQTFRRVEALFLEVLRVIEGESDLAEELHRIMVSGTDDRGAPAARGRAAALKGWLNGAVAAVSYEARG